MCCVMIKAFFLTLIYANSQHPEFKTITEMVKVLVSTPAHPEAEAQPRP